MPGKERDRDEQLARAVDHPIRVEILIVLRKNISSPKQLSEIIGEPLGNVSYHTKVLLECDCIELVKTRPARGAVEHFYRAKGPAGGPSAGLWENVPWDLREDLVGTALESFTKESIEALRAGSFRRPEGAGITLIPLRVDVQGWREIREALNTAEGRARAVGVECAARLGSSDGISVVVAVAAFEAADEKGSPKA